MSNTEIDNNKFRRGTTFSVSFPTLPSLDISPRRVDLVQKKYHHDILILEYSATSTLWFDDLKTGVPVLFTWTQGAHTEVWPGYVSHTNKVVASQLSNIMEIHCVSASYPLKERATRVFTNSTIPEAVSQICKEFDLNFVGEQHPRRFEQLAMAGHSYWEWIQEQAKRIGYGVMVVGTDLLFRPLDNLIDQSSISVPVLSMESDDQVVRNKLFDKTLDYFKVLNGDHVETQHSRVSKEVFGVDPMTGKMVKQSASPADVGTQVRKKPYDVLFSEQHSEQVVHSNTDALQTSSGLAQHGRFNTPARAKGQGDPRLKPFFPVYIGGTGGSTDGYWIVDEVHHMMHKIGDYQVELSISSDGTGQTNFSDARINPTTVIGKVNINEIVHSLANATHASLAPVNTRRFSLTSPVPVILQNDQGYNRTKARWKSPLNPQGMVR